MTISVLLRAVSAFACLLALVPRPAAAQFCDPSWGAAYEEGRLDGAPGNVYDLIEFDFGQGARLIAGGSFRSAGATPAQNIAQSTPTQTWEPLGDGLPGTVWCLESFNDGGGRRLYAGGDFGNTPGEADSGIRRWNGTAWESIGGPDGRVNDMLVWNDGTGAALYAVGSFTTVGGQPAKCIAKWNGLAWTQVGGGITGGYLNKLCLYDSAQGPRLVVAGSFVQAGTITASGLALWSGVSWSTIGPLLTSAEIIGVGQYQKPGVRELWICTTDPSLGVRRWDGSSLQSVNFATFGLNRVFSFNQATENNEQVLILGGSFLTSNNLRNLVKWNGSTFSNLVTGTPYPIGAVYATTYHRFQGDATARVAAGGEINMFIPGSGAGSGLSGPVVTTAPDRSGYRAMQTTLTTPGVRALAVGPSPAGDALYAGGSFAESALFPQMPQYIGRWQDGAWQKITPALDSNVSAMVRFRGDLIVGGNFSSTTPFPGLNLSYVARFDGTAWHAMPGFGPFNVGVASPVQSLNVAVENGQEYLYATLIAAPRSLARWDGVTWTANVPLGNVFVNDLAYGDIGAGPALYGAGNFTTGPTQQVFAKGNATTWEQIAPGQRFGVGYSIGIFDLGDGPRLFGAGNVGIQPADQPQFTFHYPVVTVRDGRWVPVGTNMTGTAYDLAVFDDGDGPALYAAGELRIMGEPAGRASGRGLAKFDGAAWQLVDGDLNGAAHTLLVLGVPSPRLLVGGVFSRAGDTTAYGVAEWLACPPCPADFDRSGGIDGADVEAFFRAWESGAPAADVTMDGGVDGADVEYFFRAWEAGGC